SGTLPIGEQGQISSFAPQVARPQVEPGEQSQGTRLQPQQDMSGNKAISPRPVEQHVLLTRVQSVQNAPHPQQTEQRLLVPQGEAQRRTTQPQQAELPVIDTYPPAPAASRSPVRSLERNNQPPPEQHSAM